MDKSKNLVQKINLINNEKNNNQHNLMYKNESQMKQKKLMKLLQNQKYLIQKKEKKFISYVIKFN